MTITSAFRNVFLIGGSFLVVALGTILYHLRPTWIERLLYFGAFSIVTALWWKHVHVPSGKVALVLGFGNEPKRLLYSGRHGLVPFWESLLEVGDSQWVWDASAREYKLAAGDRDGTFSCDVKVRLAPSDLLGLVRDLLAKNNPNFPYVCDYSSPQAFLEYVQKTAAKQFVDMAVGECSKQLQRNEELDVKDERVLRAKLQQSLEAKQQSWVPGGDLASTSKNRPYWRWIRISSVEILGVEPIGVHKRPGVPVTSLNERLRTVERLVGWVAKALGMDVKSLSNAEKIALQGNATRLFDSLQLNAADVPDLMTLYAGGK